MDSQLFSRSYLQDLPQERKQEYIHRLVQVFLPHLLNAAAKGKTSYTYYILPETYTTLPVITCIDLIRAFEKKFPDCQVSYKETLHENTGSTPFTEESIVIDWS